MDWIQEGFDSILYNLVYRLFYMLEILLCRVIGWLQSFYDIFTGIDQVKYNGDNEYLIDVFFGNKIITAAYWGMAAIGIVLTFLFAIFAVAKKAADVDDKMRQSHGQILRATLKSVLTIICLNLIITIVISSTTVLMKAVNDAFDSAPLRLQGPSDIVYTNEQYAAMGRIFNTIGNYSLNQSYNNRYNLNCCYNEIRADLKYLGDTRVFDYEYDDKDGNGDKINTWQSVLLELSKSADYNKDLNVDEYYPSVSSALNNCMEVLKTDPKFEALEEYHRKEVKLKKSESISLDRVIFLIGTMGAGNSAAARTDRYNKDPSLSDDLRRPYYVGDKDIYDFDQVNEDFDISFTKTNYVVVYFAAIAIISNMVMIVVNCIVRIFNLLFMYMIAPPIIAASPLDDGAKFKQWTTAFIVQTFSVFSTVISMKIFLMYVPIVMSPSLELSDNTLLNMIGKLIMIWAGIKAIEKADGILTGILSDNAGLQSVQAGSMRDAVKSSKVGQLASKAKDSFEGAVGSAVKGTAGAALSAAALPFKPITQGAKNIAEKVKQSASNLSEKWGNLLVSPPESPEQKKQQQQNTDLANKITSGLQSAGYGGFPNKQPPPNRQPGYGGGYHQPPPNRQPGYGGYQPPPPNGQPGNFGQPNQNSSYSSGTSAFSDPGANNLDANSNQGGTGLNNDGSYSGGPGVFGGNNNDQPQQKNNNNPQPPPQQPQLQQDDNNNNNNNNDRQPPQQPQLQQDDNNNNNNNDQQPPQNQGFNQPPGNYDNNYQNLGGIGTDMNIPEGFDNIQFDGNANADNGMYMMPPNMQGDAFQQPPPDGNIQYQPPQMPLENDQQHVDDFAREGGDGLDRFLNNLPQDQHNIAEDRPQEDGEALHRLFDLPNENVQQGNVPNVQNLQQPNGQPVQQQGQPVQNGTQPEQARPKKLPPPKRGNLNANARPMENRTYEHLFGADPKPPENNNKK